MSLISRRTLGQPDASKRLSPGQEQLLTLASALGPRLPLKVAGLSDRLLAENTGALMTRGLATMERISFTEAEEREFILLLAQAGGDRPETSPAIKAEAETRVSIYLKVTAAGEQYLRRPPTGRLQAQWWHRLPHSFKTRLMVLGTATVIGLAVKWWDRLARLF